MTVGLKFVDQPAPTPSSVETYGYIVKTHAVYSSIGGSGKESIYFFAVGQFLVYR